MWHSILSEMQAPAWMVKTSASPWLAAVASQCSNLTTVVFMISYNNMSLYCSCSPLGNMHDAIWCEVQWGKIELLPRLSTPYGTHKGNHESSIPIGLWHHATFRKNGLHIFLGILNKSITVCYCTQWRASVTVNELTRGPMSRPTAKE